MIRRKHVVLLVAAAVLAPGSVRGQWEPVSPGFEYRKYVQAGPVEVFVTRLDRSEPQTRAIDSCIAQGQFFKDGLPNGGREIPSAMATRYDQTLAFYWQTQGQRNDVIAVINGDYWERETYPSGPYTGRPASGQVAGAWYCRRFSEYSGGSGFFWTIWGVPHIGGDVRNGHPSMAPHTVYFDDGSTMLLDAVNVERGSNDFVLYTPQWADNTHTDATGIEILAEVNRPDLTLPHGTSAYSCTGTIEEIRDGAGSTPIPFDHIVLSAAGSAATELRTRAAVGETVRLRMIVRDYGFPNRTPPHPKQDWTKAYGSVGVDREILIDSQVTSNIPSPDTTRHPRTGVAFNDSHAFFIVADGRRVGSIGMTFGELADFCLGTLGATHAASLDGGGSSAMWVKGRGIVNVPSDGAQRATCNGLMMVSLLPREQSTTFPGGAEVQTPAAAPVRLGPGDNYRALTTSAPGAIGVIVDHDLSGVAATGASWWKLTIGGATGWVEESLLTTVPDPAPDNYTIR